MTLYCFGRCFVGYSAVGGSRVCLAIQPLIETTTGQVLLIHEDSIWRRNVTDQINHSITFFMKKIHHTLYALEELASSDSSHVIKLYKASYRFNCSKLPVCLLLRCATGTRKSCSKYVWNNNKSSFHKISFITVIYLSVLDGERVS